MRAVAIRILLGVCLFGSSAVGFAQNAESAKALCKKETQGAVAATAPKLIFPEMQSGARNVRRVLCIENGTREQILDALAAFIKQQTDAKWFEAFGGFTDEAGPLGLAQELIVQGKGPPNASFNELADALNVNGKPFVPRDPDKCTREARNRSGDQTSDCNKALKEFVDHYDFAQLTYSSEGALAFARAANDLSKEWHTYLNDTRSQTILELLVNSRRFKTHETQGFAPPPDMQLVLLHPSLVVENVSAAADGEKAKAALMIELAGANWWRQNKWYLPSGGSVISVFSDRAGGTENVGYGVALYFRSVYSLGYTRRGGKDGVFVSFDLLKLIEDKKQVLDTFNP